MGSALAQNIIVSGKVIDPNGLLKEDTRIYYAFNDNKYDSTQFVVCDSDLIFNIELTAEEILNHSITSMHFSNEFKRGINCSHSIHVEKIISSDLTENKNLIKITADFDYEWYCDFSAIQSAIDDGLEKFVGEYFLKRGNEKLELEVTDSYFLKVKYATPGDDFTNMEIGTWYYNSYRGTLNINIRYAVNNDFGVTRIIKKRYEIEINEIEPDIPYTSKDQEISVIKK